MEAPLEIQTMSSEPVFTNPAIDLPTRLQIVAGDPQVVGPFMLPAAEEASPSNTSNNRMLSFNDIPIPQYIGDYKIESLLGSGGMGNVFQAQNQFFGRVDALKMIHDQLESRESREAFIDEMHTQSRLDHANIVKVHYAGVCRQTGDYRNRLYLVMARVPRDLSEAIRDRGAFPPLEASNIVRRLAKALIHAHSKGVIHCDLKPKNILMDKDDREEKDGKEDGEAKEVKYNVPKITDFGLVRFLRDGQDDTTGPREGQPFGTLNYMPPEQARGERVKVNERNDIYGLGAVLYELLTGQPPYSGTREEILKKVKDLNDLPPSPRSLNPHVPVRLDAICMKCLQKRPMWRYQTAAELEGALNEFQREPLLKRRWREFAIGLLVLCLLGLGWNLLPSPRAERLAAEQDAKRLGEEARTARIRGDHADEKEQLRKAAEKYSALLPDGQFPDKLDERSAFARILVRLAEIYADDRRVEESAKRLDQAKKVLDSMPAIDSRRKLVEAELEHIRGNNCMNDGKYSEARDHYQAGRDKRIELVQLHEKDDTFLRDLSRSHAYLAGTLLRTGHDPKLAVAAYRKARQIRTDLAKRTPEIEYFCLHARDFGNDGVVAEWQGKTKLAFESYRKQIQYYDENIRRETHLPAAFLTERADTCLQLVEFLLVESRVADKEAEEWLRRGEKEHHDLRDCAPVATPAAVRVALAKVELLWGRLLQGRGEVAAAREKLEAAEAQYRALDDEGMAQADDYFQMGLVHALLASLSPVDDPERLRQQVLALDRLEKAIRKCYLNRTRFECDSALASVRGSHPKRFEELLGKLAERLNELRAKRE